jgi:RHS repeat-associated protein
MLIAAEDGSQVYQFDASGRHLFTRNASTGDTLYAFGHDSAGRLVTVRDAHANVTTIERSPTTGVATAVVAPFGQRTTLETDGAGYLSRVLDPAGNAVRLFSKLNGLLDSMVTPRGHAYRFAYDGVGRLISDQDPAGGSQSLTRTKSDTGYSIAVTTEMGRTTRYKVDRLPGGDERRETVAPTGLGTVTTRRRSGETVRTTPDGTAVTITQAADPRYGIQAPYLGRVMVRLPSGDSSVVTTSRSASLANANDPVSLRGALETVTVNGHAFTTRDTLLAGAIRTTATTPEGRQMLLRSDSLGRVRMARTGGLDSVIYRYDILGRLDRVQSGGRISSLTYDTRGRLATSTDPLGRSDSLFYDSADRLTRRVLRGGREILFAYDSSGNLTAITPPDRTVHGFGFTPVNLTGRYTPPNVGLTTPATTYSYNVARQLTRVTRPDSVAIEFDYDTPGRLGAITFDRGQLVLGYSTATGNLTSINAPGGNTLAYNYDGLLPTRVTWGGTVQGSVEIGYNSTFRVDSVKVNGANGVEFVYDRDGLLKVAGALGLKRHVQHGLVERDSIGTVKGAWSYNSHGALGAYTAMSGATTLFQSAVIRDSLDRITRLMETVQGATRISAFSYDSAGRLQEVDRDGAVTATYEYDQNGNRMRLTTPGGVLTGTYDAQDRLTTYGNASYTYGSNGELKSKTDAAGTTSYTYDALGNLTAATLNDGTEITYVIDGQNRRVGKRVNGVLAQGFLYQGQINPVAELDGSQQVVSRFVYGTRPNVPEYMIKDNLTYRLVLDHLGSVRLVVNTADGAVAQHLEYDEFGRVTMNTAPGFQPFGYAGGLTDSHTGLVRFGSRDYDPGLGRWTAKDPIQFSGGDANLYTYAGNDPIGRIDVTGRVPIFVVTAAIGGIAGGVGNVLGQIGANGGLSGFDVSQFLVATTSGLAAGAAVPYTTGIAAVAALGGALGITEYTMNSLFDGSTWDPGGAVVATLLGAAGGAVGGALSPSAAVADELSEALLGFGRRNGLSPARFNFLEFLDANANWRSWYLNLLGGLVPNLQGLLCMFR